MLYTSEQTKQFNTIQHTIATGRYLYKFQEHRWLFTCDDIVTGRENVCTSAYVDQY